MPSRVYKLLVVDDEPANVQILREILAGEGYELTFASDGEAALERASLLRPDLILLDVMMPGMDGYEVCRRLKQDPDTTDIPVIFVTVLDQIRDEEKGLNLGAIDYLTKPLGPAIVRARVRNHLRLKAYRDQLADMAMLDGLTTIANRRRFDEFLASECRRAQRNDLPISVILMDIDSFKAFNDNYGHVQGDVCLKTVASAICSALSRPADLAARYGGEEFACVLPETDADGAKTVADQILDAVRATAIPHAHSEAADVVTVSVGCLTASRGTASSPQKLVEEVDKLLYQAKEGGKNRVIAGALDAASLEPRA